MKAILVFLFFSVMLMQTLSAQQVQVYDDFEGNRLVRYSSRTGDLDSLALNPTPDMVNGSLHCAKYLRNSEKKFDVIKMLPNNKLADVSAFATYQGIPPRLKLKVYTTAPVGTLVEILLGSKEQMTAYPDGTNSQYQARTTVSGAWEDLEFKFAQVPPGSRTSFVQIDQVTLLFNPNTSTDDVYYFDELRGPALLSDKAAAIGLDGVK